MSVTILLVAQLFFTHFIYVSSLLCYACLFTYGEDYTNDSRDARCANKSFLLLNLDKTARKCAPWEKACVTKFNTKWVRKENFTTYGVYEKSEELRISTNGKDFLQIQLPDIHIYYSDMIIAVECDDCCTEDLCNANFSLSYYEEVMKRQTGSWVTPLAGELKWNKKKKYKFPY